MNWRCPDLEAEATRVAAEIDRCGYGVVQNYVSKEELEPAYNFAMSAVAAAGGEYVSFTGREPVSGTVLGDLSNSVPFKTFCRRVYELGTGRPGPNLDFYQILRCLQGRTGLGHSYRFHYDSYVLTALLPIAMPGPGMGGDLLVMPSTRRIRRFYLSNVLDKLLVDNGVTQGLLRVAARRGSSKITVVRLKPGHMYFFWGYRSIHTNAPSKPDKLRATALFHYADPHHDSRVRALLRRTLTSNAG